MVSSVAKSMAMRKTLPRMIEMKTTGTSKKFYWQEGEDKTSAFKYMTFYIDIDMASSRGITVHDKHSNLGERWTTGGQWADSGSWNFFETSGYLTNDQDSTLEVLGVW